MSVSSTLDLGACVTAQCVLTHVPEFLFVLLVSHAVKLHFVYITLAHSLSSPPSVSQSASVPCALSLSTLLLFCHLVSHSCSLPSPHLHVTLVRHIVVQASTCFISATTSTYTPGGPVLFPTTVGLCCVASSESNHQIFYYSHSSINHVQLLQIDLSLMKYQILVLTDSYSVISFYLIFIVLILVPLTIIRVDYNGIIGFFSLLITKLCSNIVLNLHSIT